MSPYDIQKRRKTERVQEEEKPKLMFREKYQLISVEEMTEVENDQVATKTVLSSLGNDHNGC